jgi:hypothetical protein
VAFAAAVGVVVIACVAPGFASVTVLGATTRFVNAFGGVDAVSAVDVPVTPPVVAEMVAVPAATVVTVAVAPVPATVATAASLDCQVMVRPVIGLPSLPVTVAVAVVVSPATSWVAVSVTDTLATDTFSTGTGVGVSSELPAQAPREIARAASAGARTRRPALRTEGNMVVFLEPVIDWERAALCKRERRG